VTEPLAASGGAGLAAALDDASSFPASTSLVFAVSRSSVLTRAGATVAAIAATAALAGCGASDAPPAQPVSGEPVTHIHGLGVDPADRSLLIATHDGLFRAPEGQSAARRIGTSTQDTMGFTVTGPRRYLGSGHPGAQEDGPPQLGLIESRDGGQEWTPVALSGQADFHVLRAAGDRVYGVDSGSGRLLVSEDRGRTWAIGGLSGPALDVAVHPDDDRRLLATTERGLEASSDAGATWRVVGPEIGMLAWSAPDELHLIDPDGTVFASGDEGRTWRQRGELGSAPVALTATGSRLLAAVESGEIRASGDGGRSWRPRAEL